MASAFIQQMRRSRSSHSRSLRDLESRSEGSPRSSAKKLDGAVSPSLQQPSATLWGIQFPRQQKRIYRGWIKEGRERARELRRNCMNTKLSRATSEFVATRLLLVASARIIRVPASLTLAMSFPDVRVAPPQEIAREMRIAYWRFNRIRFAYFGGRSATGCSRKRTRTRISSDRATPESATSRRCFIFAHFGPSQRRTSRNEQL